MTQNPKNISDLFSTLITEMSCSLVGETQEITIREASLAYKIYQTGSVTERFNCSYSLNEDFRAKFEESNLLCVGTNTDGETRIIEIPGHRFFVAMLFLPQLNSSYSAPHPVIASFLNAAGS
jgi:CTP synthase (UTP-ammonia lyase)